MAIYTVVVKSVCSGGEHILLGIKRDGVEVKQTVVTKTDILQSTTEFDEALLFFLRQAIRAAGATTMAQAKTAVEAAQWVI